MTTPFFLAPTAHDPLPQSRPTNKKGDRELLDEPTRQSESPQAHVSAIVQQANTSFGMAMRLLPRARREAIYAVYAFCRVVDDIADGDADPVHKRALLSNWRAEIARVYRGTPTSQVGQALAGPVAQFDLAQDEFELIIDGMEMDANGPIVGPELDLLLCYTRRVAGSVGMLSMRIFGAWQGAVSDKFALALADALQLTNIIRDVAEDAALGRLYLPSEYLTAAGIETREPWDVARHGALPEVCRKLGGLARERFQTARDCVAAHRRWRLVPALMMMGVYETYLRQLRGRAWRPGAEPVAFSARQKALCSLRYALLPLPRLDG